MRVGMAVGTLALCLLGCGGSGSLNSNGNGSPTPTFTGNWEIGNGTEVFQAFLSANGTSISGTIRGYTCDPTQQAYIPVNGSLNNGQLVLSGKIASPSENLSLNATVSANLTSLQGQVMYSSPACNSAQTYGVTGQQFLSVGGTWTGNGTSASGPVLTITASISEAAPDSSGFPVLSGNVTFSGSPCFMAGSLTGNQVGVYVNATISTTNGTIYIPRPTGSAALNANGQLAISYSVEGGACNGDSGTGTLGRQ